MSDQVNQNLLHLGKRSFAIVFALVVGVLVYGRDWLVLLRVLSFPEETFFEGFPNLLSPVPGVVLVVGFLFWRFPISTWATLFLPSLVAHHLIMLISSGFFNMWPAFLGAHLLLIVAMLPLSLLGAWAGRKYEKILTPESQ